MSQCLWRLSGEGHMEVALSAVCGLLSDEGCACWPLQVMHRPGMMQCPPLLDHHAALEAARPATGQVAAGRDPFATSHPAQDGPHFAPAKDDQGSGLQADVALKQQVSRAGRGPLRQMCNDVFGSWACWLCLPESLTRSLL